jgi:hypothetical protein
MSSGGPRLGLKRGISPAVTLTEVPNPTQDCDDTRLTAPIADAVEILRAEDAEHPPKLRGSLRLARH